MDEAAQPSPGSHEFGPGENEVIGKAAKWIGYWSWIAIISGILSGLGGPDWRSSSARAEGTP